jgi:hypothetical protein
MSVKDALAPDHVTVGVVAPAVVMTQASMAALKSPPPLTCQVETLGAITWVGMAQAAVPEKVRVTVGLSIVEAVFDLTISRSPTAPAAANVQEAPAADALPTQFALV